jgi:periplasmic copper chaperone A
MVGSVPSDEARKSMLVSGSRVRAALVAMGLLWGVPLYAASPAGGSVAQAGGVSAQDAWARASAGPTGTGAAYVMLMGGARDDQLVGASTPVAATAEVHQTLSENGVMKMRPAPVVAIPAGGMVMLAPEGTHIMLMGLKHPLVAGQDFPMTLRFAHSAPLTVTVTVRPLGRAAPMGDMKMQ